MTPEDREHVRAFRRQVQAVRKALGALDAAQPRSLSMAGGYIEVEGWLERYRQLSVPMRRVFMDHDKASSRRAAQALQRVEDADLLARARRAAAAYESVLAELEKGTVLGGRRVKRVEMVKAWLDAAVFYDSTDRRKPYEEMLATMGKAVEGIAAEHVEDLARAVLPLDDVAAEALGEPLHLPDPEPAQAPPADPTLRLFGWPRGRRKP